MHLEKRLWRFTEGVRGRIGAATAIGVAAAGAGVARLALLGWLIGRIFQGEPASALVLPIVLIAGVMALRGALEHWRTMIAHKTAAAVQQKLRALLFRHIARLGPAYVGRERSGAITLSLIEGVEQLETYFGQYLPQLLVSFLTPIFILAFVAWIDIAVALTLFAFAMAALLLPSLWHRYDERNSKGRQQVYAAFAAEFLDSIQGLATLKAFGQSAPRARRLAEKARDLARRTMMVLGTNVLSRGITDCSIAIGAAAALTVGALRVEAGEMALAELLIVLMMGVEIFRPMRDLRTVLHQGMVGMSAAQGVYRVLDARPDVPDAPAAGGEIAPAIAFENVGFRYPGAARETHRSLDFAVAPGERVGLVGPSGSGKSSVVRLLLRFFDPNEGRVTLGGHDLRGLSFEEIRSRISVVSQDAFLFHGTVGENIRLGRPDASADDVIAAARAANIHDFVMTLQDGYETVVGEKGVKLSGGQRQRVAIARALLRDTPILVLDEALSAVDAENEAIIQSALDRLMQGRTTLVLAHRLSSVIDCDRIVVLDEGRIVESGDHAALMARGGAYAALMRDQARESEAADLAAPAAEPEPTAAPAGETLASIPGGAKLAPTEGVIKAEGLSWAQVIAALMGVIMPWKGRLAATFFFGVTRVLAFIGVGAVSALIVWRLKSGEDYADLLIWLWLLAPLAGILHWLESWIAHDMAFRLLAEMRVDAFRKLDALAPAYLVRRRTGDLMNLATHDIELIEYFFAHTVAPAFVAILVPLGVLAILAGASPWLALALLPFLAAVAASPFLMRRRVDRLGSKAREAAGELSAFAIDSVQGLGDIVAAQAEDRRARQFDDLTARHIGLRLPFFGELTLQQSLLEAFTGLGGLAVVTVGATLVQAGAIEAGVLPLLTLLAMAAFLPVSEIAQIGRQLADTLGSTRRYYALENEPVPVTDGPGVAEAGPGAIRLEGLGFAYPGQTRRALDAIDVDMPAGQTVALVGASGAGKTTTAQMLMRFWDPDEGRVLLDGVDLRQFELDDLRGRIALVAQDTYLFNDTLRANVLIARPDASAEELDAAIERAALKDLVAALPDGLDAMVGERGASLSGGQRQRVAIARAFLKDAPILILDEATSHLDAVNEALVRQALDRLKANRTTIVIAHRLSTIRDADKIVVLDEGRVVEAGTHAELMARGGAYAALARRQLASARAAAE